MIVNRSKVLLLLLAIALVVASAIAQESTEECSGQGKKHGNHCHCNKGYKSKGLECVPTDGAAAGASCPVGGIAWELSTLVYLEKGSYTIELTKNEDDMAALLLPVMNATEATMAKLEESVERSIQLLEDITLARKLVKSKQVMAPTDKLLYIIQRNNAEELEALKQECEKTPGNTWHIDHCDGPDGHGRRLSRRLADDKMTVNLTISDSAFYAFHLQHNAVEEFGMKIVNSAGSAVEYGVSKASEEEGAEAEEETASSGGHKASGAVWAKTMAAVTVVALLSVIGIMLLAIRVSILNRLMDALMALSAGALFGASFIHILPEAIEFYSEYGQMDLSLAMIFTAGFVIAMVLEMFLEVCMSKVGGDGHHHHHAPLSGRSSALKLLSPSQQPTSNDVTNSGAFVDVETPGNGEDAVEKKVGTFSLEVKWSSIKPMAYIILLGDLFHNFVDGVLIATAFLACDDSLGVSVTVSAILHEVPQEFADFIILVDAGFTTFQAILFNFASALSAYLGAMVILSSVEVTKETMGILLGFGAGTLTYIAATDLLPRVLRVQTFADFFLRIFLFGAGVGILALTTLHHVHCEVAL